MGGGASQPTGKGIHKIIEKKDLKKLKKWMDEHGSNLLEILHHKNDEGRTPLLAAMKHGYLDDNLEIVLLLIEQGVGIEEQNKYGQSPLHVLCSSGRQKNQDVVLRKLLDKGVTIDTIDRDEMTPLMKTCSTGNVDLAMDLIEAGADLKKTDRFGFTALHYACKGKRRNVVHKLLQIGASHTCQTQDGKTPLGFALENGCEDVQALFTRIGGFRASLEKVPEGQRYAGERNDPWTPYWDAIKEKKYWHFVSTHDRTYTCPYEVEGAAGWDSDDDEDVKKGVVKATWLEKRKKKVTLANMGMMGGGGDSKMYKYSWQVPEMHDTGDGKSMDGHAFTVESNPEEQE